MALREVDYGEPGMAEEAMGERDGTAIVRTSFCERIKGGCNPFRVESRILSRYAEYATHTLIMPYAASRTQACGTTS